MTIFALSSSASVSVWMYVYRGSGRTSIREMDVRAEGMQMYIRKAFHYRGTLGWREWNEQLTLATVPKELWACPFAPICISLHPYMYLPSLLYFFFKSPSVVCEMMRMEIKERLAQFNGQVSLMDIMTYLYFWFFSAIASRTFASISSANSGLSFSKALAASRPWPSLEPL